MSRKLVDSGVAWIGKIPEGWKVCRFKDAVRLYTGDSIADNQKAEFEDPSDARPYVSSKDINLDYNVIDYNNGMYVKLDDDRFEVAPKNSVLMCIEGGSAGRKKAFVEKDVCFVNKLCCFYSEHESNRYIYHFLCSPNYAECFRQHLTGMIGGVSTTDLKNINLLLPPLAEQQRIAAFLDRECEKINGLRGKIEKQIAKLDELKKSTITEAVTKGLKRGRKMKPSGVEWIGDVPEEWKVNRVKNVGSARNGLTYSPNDVTDEKSGTLILRSSNVQGGQLAFEDNVYVSTAIPEELWLKEDDILICSRNGSRELIGKNALIPAGVVASYGAFMMVFRAGKVNANYAYWLFNSRMFSYYLGAFSTATINQLTRADFGEMRIPFPPLAEQKEIAEYLDKKCAAIDAAKEKCRVQLEKLAEYKKSLIYEYVTGKKEVA